MLIRFCAMKTPIFDHTQLELSLRTYAPCMEYLPTFARTKSPSFVGKYTSTMVRIWGGHELLQHHTRVGGGHRISWISSAFSDPWRSACVNPALRIWIWDILRSIWCDSWPFELIWAHVVVLEVLFNLETAVFAFPTCQVRVSRFIWFYQSCMPPTLHLLVLLVPLRSQWALPDIRECQLEC